MTMAISHKSDKSPDSSKCKSQLMQKKTWDAKRNLVKKRLMSLTQAMKNEKPENAIIPITSSQPEVKTTTVTQSSCGISASAMNRALEVQANLSPQLPSCVKLMLKSHVSGGFWLSLPKQFCDLHLPNHDADVFLVDESEKEYKTNYLVQKNGLSGGWRGFSIAKELLEGDVVIFQRVKPCKLKVYIIRAKTLTGIDGAVVSLLNLDSHAKPMNTGQLEGSAYISEPENLKYEEPLLLDNSCNVKNTSILISDSDNGRDMNSGSEVLEGIRFSECDVNFRDVKKFEDFTIQVDGLILDSEIPTHLRRKYYELCSSQDMFLHDNLIEGLNCNLATGLIFETINIADAIREVKSVKSVKDLESWDRTLYGCEDFGMRVGFIRDRIRRLVNVYQDSQAEIELKRRGRDEVENEMNSLKEKLLKVGALVKVLDSEIDNLVAKNDEELDSVFMEVAGASW